MRIIDIIERTPYYLMDTGNFSDIVMFTKMIMKRNISDYYFVNKMREEEKEDLIKNIVQYFDSKKLYQNHFNPIEVGSDEIEILKERFLIPSNFKAKSKEFLMFNNDFDSGIILNYEDHITIINIISGLNPETNYENIINIFYLISKEYRISIHEKFGYLTSSPLYVGTGIILESFLHLPAIVITNKLKKLVFDAAEKGFLIYPYFEDNESALGSIFIVRNKYTMKYSEEELIDNFKKFIESIVKLEYNERKYIIENAKKEIEDRIFRAYGVLVYAKLLMFDEFLNLFSAYKLGLNYGIIKEKPIDFINKLIIFTQNNHLRYIIKNNELTENEKRAKFVKLNIGGNSA